MFVSRNMITWNIFVVFEDAKKFYKTYFYRMANLIKNISFNFDDLKIILYLFERTEYVNYW